MDKRSLLFLFCVSIAFFGVHTWFSMSQEKEQAAQQIKVREQQVQREKELTTEVALRTAKAEELPLFDFFADKGGAKKLGKIAGLGGHYLALAWQQPLPEKIYVEKGGLFEPLRLVANAAQVGQPVLYSQSSSSCEVPTIPLEGEFDFQLVPLNTDPFRVIFGQQKKGEFSIPFQYLGEKAVAFLNAGGVYFPVGIYDPSAKRVKQLREFHWLQNLVEQGQPIALSPATTNEEFYVLENTYQQLVFSTRGGSLAEINLPLKLSKDSESYVREIDIDRQILAQSPQNARFPLHPYRIPTSGILQSEGNLGGYYPLLRRSILNSDGTVKNAVPPEAYALNIVGDDPEVSALFYRVTRFESNLIQFVAETGQRKITKTFFIPEERNGPYCLQLEVQIEGDARGLMITSGVPDVELVGGAYTPLLRYQVTVNGSGEVETIDLPKKGPITGNAIPNWISNCNGFLGIILDPVQEKTGSYKVVQFEGARIPTRLSLIDSAYRLYPPENYPGYATYLPLQGGVKTPLRIFCRPL